MPAFQAPPRSRRIRRARRGFPTINKSLPAVLIAGLVVALSTVYVGTTGAVSTAALPNGAQSVQAGQIFLTDDDSGNALYTTAGNPLDTGQVLAARCIALTYTGSWSATSFDGGPLTSWDASKYWADNPGNVGVSGGVMNIAATDLATTVEIQHSNLQNKNFQAEFRQLPASGDGDARLSVWKSSGNSAQFIVYQQFAKVEMRLSHQGIASYTSLPYEAAAMKFFRLSTRGQDLRWQYSADGFTWTTGRQAVINFDLDGVVLATSTHKWAGATATPVSTFANIRITPHVGIRLVATPSGALAPYLNLSIERGTGGSNASCAGFTPQTTVYTGTLAGMPSTYAAADPTTEWNPSSNPQTVTYRITGSVADNPAAAGKTAAATFTWSAHAGD